MNSFSALVGPRRDVITILFAAALHGDTAAERQLRELAVHQDRAADALCALALCADGEAASMRPADIAMTDQVIAAVLEAVEGVTRRLPASGSGEIV